MLRRWAEDVRPQLVTRDTGKLFNLKNPISGHTLPTVEGGMLDPERCSEGYRSTGFLSRNFNNLDHAPNVGSGYVHCQVPT